MSAGHIYVNTAGNGSPPILLAILAGMGNTAQSGTDQKRSRKRSQLADWQIDDANRLMVVWASFRRTYREVLVAGKPQRPSQTWLAKQCGVTQSAISFYLNGEIALNIDALLKFSTALRARPEDISPTLAKRLEVVRVGDTVFSAEAIEIARNIDAIQDPKEREFALRAARAVTAKPTENERVEKAFKTNERPRIKGRLVEAPTLFRLEDLQQPGDDDDED